MDPARNKRAQHGLLQEDTLNHIRDHYVIQGIFLTKLCWALRGSNKGLGTAGFPRAPLHHHPYARRCRILIPITQAQHELRSILLVTKRAGIPHVDSSRAPNMIPIENPMSTLKTALLSIILTTTPLGIQSLDQGSVKGRPPFKGFEVPVESI